MNTTSGRSASVVGAVLAAVAASAVLIGCESGSAVRAGSVDFPYEKMAARYDGFSAEDADRLRLEGDFGADEVRVGGSSEQLVVRVPGSRLQATSGSSRCDLGKCFRIFNTAWTTGYVEGRYRDVFNVVIEVLDPHTAYVYVDSERHGSDSDASRAGTYLQLPATVRISSDGSRMEVLKD